MLCITGKCCIFHITAPSDLNQYLCVFVFLQERVSLQFPRGRLWTGRCDHDVSRCSVRPSPPSLSSSFNPSNHLHATNDDLRNIFIFFTNFSQFSQQTVRDSSCKQWELVDIIHYIIQVLTSYLVSGIIFIIYHHHHCPVFSVFPCRLCLNGKLVSQTADSGKWL